MNYKISNIEKIINLIAFLVITLFFAFNLYAYAFVDSKLIFTDEISFFGRAPSFSDHGIKNIIFGENKLGYGAIYWLSISIFKLFGDFNNSFRGLRFLSFLYLLSIPILFFLIGNKLKQKQFILHSILLWISFPSSWFFGKIIGPELFSIFLGLFGIYLTLHKKWKSVGFVIIGIGIGVKLNIITISLFAFQYGLLNQKTKLKYKNILLECKNFILCTCLGIIISTPRIILEPLDFINNIFIHGKNKIFEFDLIDVFFLRNHLTWDGVHNDGFFNIHINILLLLLLSAALIFKKIKVTNTKFIFSYLVAFFFQTIQISQAGNYLEWYWLPLISLTPIFFFSIKHNRLSRMIITLFVFLNFYFNSSSITNRIKNRIIHQNIVQNRIEIKSFISNIKTQYRNYNFFYFTEFWIEPLPKLEHWAMLHESKKYDIEKKLKKNTSNQNPIILFLGTRFLRMDNKWKEFIKNTGDNSNYEIQLLDKCQGMHAYLIK
ncbi:MAG: hypothetical protein ACJZ10_06120 [Candidatus Neomarinimicrobiota bacterium]